MTSRCGCCLRANRKPVEKGRRSIDVVDPDAIDLCVDMQRIFAGEVCGRHPGWSGSCRGSSNSWRVNPSAPSSPVSSRRARRRKRPGSGAVFPPLAGRDPAGDDASLLDIVPELARFAPPAAIVDKPAYSAFFRSPLTNFLQEKGVRTVIVSGAETDVCVLSTVLDAVNIGFRVVLVEDALCSSSDAGHDALMTMYRLRFSEQIDLVTAMGLMEIWRPEQER